MSNSMFRDVVAMRTAIAVVLYVFSFQGLAQERGADLGSVGVNDAEQHYRSGLAAFKASKWAEALRSFEIAARDSTGYLRLCATNMVGQVQRLQGRTEDAHKTFECVAGQAHAVSRDGGAAEMMTRNAEVIERLAIHYQAEIAQEMQDWVSAISHYEQLLSMGEAKGEKAADDLCASPLLFEKLGRLYWRVGLHDKAREIFAQSLERWPTDSRAPLIRLALIALDDIRPAVQEPKLAFVICPIGQVEMGTTQMMMSDDRVSVTLPKLPSPHSPQRYAVDRLVSDLPPDNCWRPVVLCELGWMLFEEGRFEESASAFAEASSLSGQPGAPTWHGTISNYADMSRAIICLRQGKLSSGKVLVDGVHEHGLRGHLRTLTSSITSSLMNRQIAGQVGAKCDMKKLE